MNEITAGRIRPAAAAGRYQKFLRTAFYGTIKVDSSIKKARFFRNGLLV
jgi:hypothetical protein